MSSFQKSKCQTVSVFLKGFCRPDDVKQLRGNVKKKSLFKDIIHIGGWVVKAFSKFFNKLIFDIRWGQIPF